MAALIWKVAVEMSRCCNMGDILVVKPRGLTEELDVEGQEHERI